MITNILFDKEIRIWQSLFVHYTKLVVGIIYLKYYSAAFMTDAGRIEGRLPSI